MLFYTFQIRSSALQTSLNRSDTELRLIFSSVFGQHILLLADSEKYTVPILIKERNSTWTTSRSQIGLVKVAYRLFVSDVNFA